jgi:hypothetical protein
MNVYGALLNNADRGKTEVRGEITCSITTSSTTNLIQNGLGFN